MKDLVFPIIGGQTLPLDHSYALFGALCRRQPAFHGHHPVGVFPITGRTEGETLTLASESCLRLRLPSDRVSEGEVLQNAWLELDGTRVRLGSAQVQPVQTAPDLYSRWVTFNGASTYGAFQTRLRDLLARQGIDSPTDSLLPSTRTLKGMRVTGFPLTLRGLSLEQSLSLCEQGLGGRRHFGGGLFLPD